jgi:hypothetical protein
MGKGTCVSLALVTACTLTAVTKVALLLFTIYSIQTINNQYSTLMTIIDMYACVHVCK